MHICFTKKALGSISLLILSAFLLTVAHAQDAQTRQQMLSDLYQQAQSNDALWRGVTQRYQQAMEAMASNDLATFNALYDGLHFELSAGLQQAKEQQADGLVPTYLRQ